MLKSSEDRALAFFESLIIEPNGVRKFRDIFFGGVEESFISTFRSDEDLDVIYVNDKDDYDNPITRQYNYFKGFLKDNLTRETKRSRDFIKTRHTKRYKSKNLNNNIIVQV